MHIKDIQSLRLSKMKSYAFAELFKKAKLIEQKTGKKVLNLATGDPDIPPNPVYKEKLRQLVKQNNLYRYPPYGASENFSEALIRWYKNRFDVTLKPDELYALHGGKEGVSLLPLALCNPGDELLIPDPGYPAYSGTAELAQARVIRYKLNQKRQFKPDVKEIEQLISKRTKAIWLNFPSNPTGQVLTKVELEPLVQLARDRNLILLYDNAYSEITYDGFCAPSILEIKGTKEIAVEIGSFSKTYSFSGLRLGWIAGNSKVIAAFAKLKSQLDSGIPLLFQELGAFVLTHPDKVWQEKVARIYEERRNQMIDILKQLHLISFIPKGATYLWAKIPETEETGEQYCLKMLQQSNVLLAPGTTFGPSNNRFIRVSLCADSKKVKEYLNV